MKKISLLFIVCLLLSSSCKKDVLIENVNVTSPKEVKTRAEFYCYGGNTCIPDIEIYGNYNSAEIRWYGPSNNDHRLRLSCSGANGYIYRAERIEPNGTWFFDFPEITDSYKITCTISCGEYSCNCSKSLTFRKPGGDAPGGTGSGTECFKDYLPYEARVENNDLVLELTGNGYELVEDTERYMWIDAIEVYYQARDSFGRLRKVYEQLVNSPSVPPYVIRFTNLPGEPCEYYEVHLFSSQCERNDVHYIYFTYDDELCEPIFLETCRFH